MWRNRKLLTFLLLGVAGLCCLAALASGIWLWPLARSQPRPENQVLFEGIQYQREVRQSPRKMVIHLVSIDLRAKGISFLVTPGDPKAELPLKARTTSQFLEEFRLQLAINGDGARPWYSNSPLDYYPRSGDPVEPIGLAASQGIVYSKTTDNEPVLYLSRTNQAGFNSSPEKIYNAISGNLMLVEKGQVAKPVEEGGTPEPRTAVGLDRRSRKLILIVVDGRQPGYSEGATLSELAQIMIQYGAFTAMNLDGGGSCTLVTTDTTGKPDVLNSPIDNLIPGRERPVGNHLGVFAER